MDAYEMHMMTLDPVTVAAESFHTKAHRDMVAGWEHQKTLEKLRPKPGRSHDENLERIGRDWASRDKAEADRARAARVTARRPQAISRAMPEPILTIAQMTVALRAQEKE